MSGSCNPLNKSSFKMLNGVCVCVRASVRVCLCVGQCSWTCEIALLDLKLLLFAKIIYESFNSALSLAALDGLVHY